MKNFDEYTKEELDLIYEEIIKSYEVSKIMDEYFLLEIEKETLKIISELIKHEQPYNFRHLFSNKGTVTRSFIRTYT